MRLEPAPSSLYVANQASAHAGSLRHIALAHSGQRSGNLQFL